MNSQFSHSLIADLLDILRHPMASFVYNRFSKAHPDDFSSMMEQYLKHNQNAIKAKQENPLVFEQRENFAKAIDIHGVLHLIDKGWSDAFEDYPDSLHTDARILLEYRNSWAHQKDVSFQQAVETAKRLLAQIGTPSAKKAAKKIRQLLRKDYYQHIRLPEHYIPRDDLLDQVRLEMSSSGSAVIALHGMGGVGKSVLVRALCNDQTMQGRFSDGILWMTLGSQVDEKMLSQKLLDWIRVLNGPINFPDPSNREALKNCLAELLKDRAYLLVLDDVWRKSHFEAFHVGGIKCSTIMTTRDAEIARDVGAKIISVSVMNESLAIELLEKWSQGKLATTPQEIKHKVVKRLDGLPLAVKLAGAQLQSKSPQTWLENFDARKLKSNRPENVHDSLQLTFDLSLDTLDSRERKLYAALSIFKEDVSIHEDIITRLWASLGQLSLDSTQDLVTDLASRALCEVLDDTFPRSIILHSLLRGFVQHELGDMKTVHQALLSAYQEAQTGMGWHTVPDDGYFYNFFAYHLQQADALDILRQCLFDYLFLQAKLNAAGLPTLIMDYDYLPDDPSVKLIQSTLVISGNILDHLPEQLPVNLYSRLMPYHDKYPEIASLVQACYNSQDPYLFPITQTLESARGVLGYVADDNTLKYWQVQMGEEPSEQGKAFVAQHMDTLMHLLYSPSFWQGIQQLTGEAANMPPEHIDTIPAVSSSNNWGKMKGTTVSLIVNIDQPLEHSASVNSIALWNEFAVTASDDGTLKVWNWQTGEELRTFKGHTASVLSVSLSDEFAESVSSDNTVKVWNWHTGEELKTLKRDTNAISSEAGLGQFAVTPSDNNTLKAWKRYTDEYIIIFYADSPQNAVAITPDASVIISGGQNGRVHFLRPNPALMEILRER
ncbi:MAG: hypothetical protein BroJett018_20740 [Chloroflexota bacterium]|nr:MAG: hypothetical protein BroJett018_20740 [Chloroflexota bacterium]